MPIRPTHQWLTCAALACVAAILASGKCGSAPALARPNVLLLVMDTTRADRCSVTGYARPTTPRLDEFAKDAVVFTRTWSPSNWTGPAHAALFTGAGSAANGFTGGTRKYLDARLPVLAERFAAAGYDTACFSNNPFVSPGFGLTRGFARFDALFLDSVPYPVARETHERAADWAEAASAAGRPFFLFINDMEPHLPYSPPADMERAFVRGAPGHEELVAARSTSSRESVAFDLGLTAMDARQQQLLSDLYDAEVCTLDREIGSLLDRLRAGGLLDSTVVVIVGDHGESIGEHHRLGHSESLYRQVLHVPLLVRQPGRFDGGRVIDDLVRLEDVAPTLLDVCGLPPFEGVDGSSLTRDLGGRVARAVQAERGEMFARAAAEFPEADATELARSIRSVFDGAFHLVVYSDGTRELFDVARDPQETNDVSAREPAHVTRLEALLAPR